MSVPPICQNSYCITITIIITTLTIVYHPFLSSPVDLLYRKSSTTSESFLIDYDYYFIIYSH